MNRISSSRAFRLPRRSAGRLLVRRVTTASASAVQHHEPVPFPSHPLPNAAEPSKSNRRQAVKQAKPFSDFLTDTFNRQHDYLRISVTERCNLRCLYCMPEEGVPLSPQAHLLTTPEIYYLSSLFVSQGVTKIRLTGGEPTVRPDIVPLMQQIGSLRPKGLRELALTTNGISLHRKLDKMVEAGLTGLNISLDTLDPFQFQILTRRKGFDAVMKSIDRVLEMNKLGAGVKLKINCVVMRGMNDREIVPFVEMGREKDIEVRFIEYMPFDGNKWSQRKMLPYKEMLDIIREKYPGVRKVQGHFNDTSKTYEIPGFVGKLGFITSMTHNFCGSCNRLRITGDGNLKVCLFGNAEVSLRDLIRQDNNNQPIDQQAFEAIKEVEMNRRQGIVTDSTRPSWSERETELLNVIGMAVKRKKEKHAGMGELENMKNRPMILIADGSAMKNKQPWQSHRPSIVRPSLKATWSNIPAYMLSSQPSFMSYARMYSTGTRAGQEQVGSLKDPQSIIDNASDSDLNSSIDQSAQESSIDSTFQSLSSLFVRDRQEVAKAPWSAPEEVSQEMEDKATVDQVSSLPTPAWSRSIDRSRSKRHIVEFDSPPNSSSAQFVNGGLPGDVRYVQKGRRPKGRITPASEVPAQEDRKVRRQRREPTVVSGMSGKNASSNATLPPWKLPSIISKASSAELIPSRDSLNLSNASSVQTRSLSERTSEQIGQEEEDDLSGFSDLPQESVLGTYSALAESSSSSNTNKAPRLTHVTSSGEAHMVNVAQKVSTNRIAVACGHVIFSDSDTFRLIAENSNKKGDVLGVARVAGIMAAKRCSDIIPLCHPIAISKVTVELFLIPPGDPMPATKNEEAKYGGVHVEARVHCFGPTGVEMEALTAVTGAGLTVYDMCKAVDKSMIIGGSRVMLKHGGKSGPWSHSLWRDLLSWRKARDQS